uniref:Reverse transcriptase n=1 Tax=Triatoma infestans TaxID=30076 RepID=A0A170VB98_TRIIF
MTWNPHTRLKR